jgi:hypothetical protein
LGVYDHILYRDKVVGDNVQFHCATSDYFQLFLGGGTTTEKVSVQSLFETQLTLQIQPA